jgi:hypothetical protein
MEIYFGAVHKWIQRNFMNGDRVTWGSNDVLGQVTVKQLEELSVEVSKEMEKRVKQDIINQIEALKNLYTFDVGMKLELEEIVDYIKSL